jgi:hypothetical protein
MLASLSKPPNKKGNTMPPQLLRGRLSPFERELTTALLAGIPFVDDEDTLPMGRDAVNDALGACLLPTGDLRPCEHPIYIDTDVPGISLCHDCAETFETPAEPKEARHAFNCNCGDCPE